MTVLFASLLLAGVAPAWSVNPNHALMWDDKPYVPVGVRISGDPDRITKGLAAGVRDFIVDLPADGTGWDEAVGTLEKGKARYVISVGTPSPRAQVFAVEPDEYRVPNIEGPYHFDFAIPDADRALVIMVQQTSAAVRWRKTMPVVNGRLKIDDDRGPGAACVLLIYPYMKRSEVTDFWEPFDGHRDMILATLGKFKAGPGLRGLLNPLGKVKAFVPEQPEYVPQSPMFQVELEAFLRKNYPSPTALARAWSMSFNGLTEFSEFAKLLPLWNSKRGLPMVYDPANDRLYSVETPRSRMWSDLRQVMEASANRRYRNLVDAVQQAVGVPVIEEWRGWGGPYEGDVPTAGVGAVLSSPRIAPLMGEASRPASTVLRSPSRFGWGTDIKLSSDATSASPGDTLELLESIGLRGFFFRCDSDAQVKAVAALAEKHDAESAQWKPNALYFPEAANDPAAPGRLGSGLWWLPAPIPGQRLDLGPNLDGYLFTDSAGPAMAVWSPGGTRKVVFKLNNPDKVSFMSTDNAFVTTKVKKQLLEVDLGPAPVIVRGYDAMPVPMEDYTQSLLDVRAAIDNFPRIADTEGDSMYKIKNIMDGFDRNPEASYRLLKELQREKAVRIAPYMWIEAEKTPDLLYASRGPRAGASEGTVLLLGDMLGLGGRTSVSYNLRPRQAGNHEVWVAAAVKPEDRGAVTVRVGSKSFTLTATPPVSFYGDGLGWYKVGEIELNGPETLMLSTDQPGVRAAVDVVMLSPAPFVPKGPRPPLEFLKALQQAPKPPGASRGRDSGGA